MTVTVTDHAVLRYLERVCGVETEAVRVAIADGCARGAEAGAPVIRFNGARFLLRGHVVVTAIADEHWCSHETMSDLMSPEDGGHE